MDKRLMLALGVTSIWGSAESVYALAQHELVETRQHVGVKPSSAKQVVKRDNNSKLRLSISVKGEKKSSFLQPLKNKKLSKKESRVATKKFALALKASKKKGVRTLIQTRKKARLIAKQNRKAALRIKKIERKRLQFRKKWQRQEAKLQAKKSRLLKRNPVLLNKKKLQEQIVLNRLKKPTVNNKEVKSAKNVRPQAPISSLVLQATNMAKKTVFPVQKASVPIRPKETLVSSGFLRGKSLPLVRSEDNSRKQPDSSLLTTIARKKTAEMQTRFEAANDSSEQSVVKKQVVENSAPLSLVKDELSAVNVQPSSLSLLSSGEHRDAVLQVGGVNNDTEVDENINHVPNQSVSKDLTLQEGELTSENLAPFLRGITDKIWDFVKNTSKEVSATSSHSLEALREITTFTDVVNKMVQQIHSSVRQENDPALEGGHAGDSLNDEEGTTLDSSQLYPQTQHGQTSTQEEKDLKKDRVDTSNDLKKDKTFVPVAAKESDLDMVVRATQIETLEETISQFQRTAFHLRGIVEVDGSKDIEENKVKLRNQLYKAFIIEKTLSSLKFHDSGPAAASVNSLLENHEESIGKEKLRLSIVLRNLLKLEKESNLTSSISHSTQIVQVDEDETIKGGSDTSSTTALAAIDEEGDSKTRTSNLDNKDIELEDKSSLVSKSVATDSDEFSTHSFPTVLGSLKELLDGVVDRVGLNSVLTSEVINIKVYSRLLKEKLLSIETGEEHKSSSSTLSTQEDVYDFASDMKGLHSQILHYLTLPAPASANYWLRNFDIDTGKNSAVQLIKELRDLNQKFEEKAQKEKEQSSSPSEQQIPPVAVVNQPSGFSLWNYVPFSRAVETGPSVASLQLANSNNSSNGTNSSNNTKSNSKTAE